MLTEIIQSMLNQSMQTGQVQRRRLKNGLYITILMETGRYKLILSRVESYPSDREWQTVIRNWPYPVHAKPPEKKHAEMRNILSGYVQKRTARQLTLE